MKRLKEDDYIAGMKKETYNLLFKDENLPELNEEEAQKSKENDRILNEIEFFTILDDNIIKDERLGKQLGFDFSKFICHGKDKKYEYILGDKIIPFEKLSDRIQNEEIKKELMSEERYKMERECHLKVITLILIEEFRQSNFHIKWNVYKRRKEMLTFCN